MFTECLFGDILRTVEIAVNKIRENPCLPQARVLVKADRQKANTKVVYNMVNKRKRGMG